MLPPDFQKDVGNSDVATPRDDDGRKVMPHQMSTGNAMVDQFQPWYLASHSLFYSSIARACRTSTSLLRRSDFEGKKTPLVSNHHSGYKSWHEEWRRSSSAIGIFVVCLGTICSDLPSISRELYILTNTSPLEKNEPQSQHVTQKQQTSNYAKLCTESTNTQTASCKAFEEISQSFGMYLA